MTVGLKGYINKDEYIAQHVSFDAYPSGLGWEFYMECKNGSIDSKILVCDNKINNIKNSLICEWAYFYDPENKIFEIWKGFQTQPDTCNPFGFECDEFGYYPCKRIFKGHINTINSDIFLNDKTLLESVLKSIERDNKLKEILK